MSAGARVTGPDCIRRSRVHDRSSFCPFLDSATRLCFTSRAGELLLYGIRVLPQLDRRRAKAILWRCAVLGRVFKLNHHFPAVVRHRSAGSGRPLAVAAQADVSALSTDLRPSQLAVTIAHAGTLPRARRPARARSQQQRHRHADRALDDGGGIFITSSVPMGVPIRWNVVVVYRLSSCSGHMRR